MVSMPCDGTKRRAYQIEGVENLVWWREGDVFFFWHICVLLLFAQYFFWPSLLGFLVPFIVSHISFGISLEPLGFL